MQWRGDDDDGSDWSRTQLLHARHAAPPPRPGTPLAPARTPYSSGVSVAGCDGCYDARRRGPPTATLRIYGVYFTRNFYTRYIGDGENIASILSTTFLSFLAITFGSCQCHHPAAVI